LTTYYDAAGRWTRSPCPTLGGAPPDKGVLELFFGGGLGPLISEDELYKPPKVAGPAGPLLAEALETDQIVAYPAELTVPPLDWLLPPTLARHLGGLDGSAGLRFGRFAADCGVRFAPGGDVLRGIGDPVLETTIEAVTDAQGRPYALWVRTPEPVDWRRVTVALSVRHVEPPDECPTRYAHRQPLALGITVLPSPDGTSGFLVATFTGRAIVLPRGEYTLTLRFDPAQAGLPPLRPSLQLGTGSELVTLRFVQPLGKTWPQPSDGVYIPNHLVEIAVKYLKFPAEAWIEAYQTNMTAEELERRIDAISTLPRPAPTTDALLESPRLSPPEGGST
jgi:hypothetical protein